MKQSSQFVDNQIHVPSTLLDLVYEKIRSDAGVKPSVSGDRRISERLKAFLEGELREIKDTLDRFFYTPKKPNEYRVAISESNIGKIRLKSANVNYATLDLLCMAAWDKSLAYCLASKEFEMDSIEYSILYEEYGKEEYHKLRRYIHNTKKQLSIYDTDVIHYSEIKAEDNTQELETPHEDLPVPVVDISLESSALIDSSSKETTEATEEISGKPKKESSNYSRASKIPFFVKKLANFVTKGKYAISPRINFSIPNTGIYPFSRIDYYRSGKGRVVGVYGWFIAQIYNDDSKPKTLNKIRYFHGIDRTLHDLEFIPVQRLWIEPSAFKYSEQVMLPATIQPQERLDLFIFLEMVLPPPVQEALFEIYRKRLISLPEIRETYRNVDFWNSINSDYISIVPTKEFKLANSYFEEYGVLQADFVDELKKLITDPLDWEAMAYFYKDYFLNTLYFFDDETVFSNGISHKTPFWFFGNTHKQYASKNTPVLSEKDAELLKIKDLINYKKYSEAKIKIEEYDLKFKTKNSEYYLRYAQIQRGLKNHEIALENFRKANELSPNNLVYVLALSFCYFDLKKYSEAIENLEDIIKVNKAFGTQMLSQIYELIAYGYRKSGNNERAAEYLYKIIPLIAGQVDFFKDEIKIKLDLITVLLQSNKLEDAKKIIFPLEIDLRDKYEYYYTQYIAVIQHAGTYYQLSRHYDDAILFFKKVLSFLKKLPSTEYVYETLATVKGNMATVLSMQNNNDDAIIEISEAIYLAENKIGNLDLLSLFYSNYGSMLAVMGKTVDAKKYYEKALSIRKDLFGTREAFYKNILLRIKELK